MAIYWATNELDENCEIGKRADTVKNEVSVDGYQLRFQVENIAYAKRQMMNLIGNYVTMLVQDDIDSIL